MGFSISDITSVFSRPKPEAATGQSNQQGAQNPESYLGVGPGTYQVMENNWYTAKPYGFKLHGRDGKTNVVMFLPISPSNLTINTNFATNVISTLYGTIEEHSDIRYFDINIEGTTGMAPKFVNPLLTDNVSTAYSTTRRSGRASTPIANSLALGGFFAKTLGALNQAKEKAADLLDGGVKPKTGIIPENSGYVAFHNLYRFLLKYKKDTAGISSSESRDSHPLTFFNYKDNNQYDVAVRGFTLRRSADNPMLYYYSIQLRGYNLRSIGTTVDENLSKRLNDLGLTGIDSSSALGDIKSLASGVKGVIGSLAGGLNVLGR